MYVPLFWGGAFPIICMFLCSFLCKNLCIRWLILRKEEVDGPKSWYGENLWSYELGLCELILLRFGPMHKLTPLTCNFDLLVIVKQHTMDDPLSINLAHNLGCPLCILTSESEHCPLTLLSEISTVCLRYVYRFACLSFYLYWLISEKLPI